MTPSPAPADLPGPWPDALAAYADGELDPAARAAVERWLAAHPEGWRCVRGQQAVSPENWRLWRDAAPPDPAPEAWDAVRENIAAGLALTPPTQLAEPAPPGVRYRLARWALTTAAYGLTAAVVAFALLGPWYFTRPNQKVQEQTRRAPADDPLHGFAVLPIVPEGEVDVWRVDGAGAGGWLPVGGAPLAGPLALAAADDVDVEEAEAHPAWPTGKPDLTRGPADAPVLWPNR